MGKLLLYFFSHRFLAIARWELHFLALRLRNAFSLQNRRIRHFLVKNPGARFMNLGSGPRGRDDGQWINVDGFSDSNVHFLLDISRRLPFPDGTFQGVFCEHVLEHFSLEDGERLAAEVYRLLSPNGRFRIIVPDGEKIIRQYLEAPQALMEYRGPVSTGMEAVNSFFRQRYEHQFLYDFESMEQILKRAGFERVELVSYCYGMMPDLVLDDPKYAWESLYVEAVRNSHET